MKNWIAGTALVFLLGAGSAIAGEKKLMHCFAFTPIETASQAEWDAFYKATDAIVGKVPGVTRVWYGKLRQPLAIFQVDAEARKKLGAGEKDVAGKVTRLMRQHGVCMEMDDAGTLKTYAAHPYHEEWMDAYVKVRVAGTTTFDILGQ
ncbi:MAG: hypothetical protein HYS04_20170 [Acidobacteria bacterium]|nr:hypothetical protein [Acidobacteriota bacterium]